MHKRENRDTIIKKLIERDGKYCSKCKKTLNENEISIEHIIPLACGGTEQLKNMRLLCQQCNCINSDKSNSFFAYQFKGYIKTLLSNNESYSNIRCENEGSKIATDIVFERKKNEEVEIVFAELKPFTSYTEDRIKRIINKLKVVKQSNAMAKVAFIFPGELSTDYVNLICQEGIEIWDKKFLIDEFKDEIMQMDDSTYSRMLLSHIEENEGGKIEISNYNELINRLKACPNGTQNWGEYQKIVGEVLECLFCPELGIPISQSDDSSGKNRRDYIMSNYSNNPTWCYFRERYKADFVVFDAKNSGKEVNKNDILQVSHYLKKDGVGLLGIILSRKGPSKTAEYAIREEWLLQGKMIVVLNDTDVEQMLLDKKNKSNPEILIRKKIEDFRLSI